MWPARHDHRGLLNVQHSVRRVVTGHDADGHAVVRGDSRHEMQIINDGEAWFAKLWTSAMPADNHDETDGALVASGLTLAGGTVLRIVDMPPGHRSAMHRTSSLDYGIVLSGEVHLELDQGRTVKLCAGDVVVQRGTIHAWENRGGEFARMAFVLISAAAYRHEGRELAPE